MSHSQSEAEFEKHLQDEVAFLVDACAKFDHGTVAYAKIIATSVRKLVHQTASSDALLTHLGVLDKWHWKDTADELVETNLLHTFGLVSTTISWGEGADAVPVTTYSPVLDEYPRAMIPRASAFSKLPVFRERGTPMPFDFWWNRPIIRDLERNDFSRRDVITNVANKDGGAHIDAKIGRPFADLSRGGSMAIPAEGPTGEFSLSLESPVPATVRQIGFEVLRTIQHFRPDLVHP